MGNLSSIKILLWPTYFSWIIFITWSDLFAGTSCIYISCHSSFRALQASCMWILVVYFFIIYIYFRSEAKDLLGDDWVQRHRRIVQQNANSYKRSAWSKVVFHSCYWMIWIIYWYVALADVAWICFLRHNYIIHMQKHVALLGVCDHLHFYTFSVIFLDSLSEL